MIATEKLCRKSNGSGIVTGGEAGGKALPPETFSNDMKAFLKNYK